MSFTVFYMNPGATTEVCQIVRNWVPEGWRLLTPQNGSDFFQELSVSDFIVVATQPVTAEHVRHARRLKMIQHQGVGYDQIDLAACRKRGIPVGLTPEGTSVGVAEHSLLLILAVYKRLTTVANEIVRGNWMQWSLRQVSYEFKGKTIGLIGFGRIGQEVAKRAAAFDARVIYYDPFVEVQCTTTAVRVDALETLLRAADIVSLHLPETEATHHLVNAQTIAMMKSGAILINTARGGLVDEQALIAAIECGQLGGAGLDVFELEPLPASHPLSRLPNVVCTPHIAAGTRDALNEKMKAVFANLRRFTIGEPLENVVPELQDMSHPARFVARTTLKTVAAS